MTLRYSRLRSSFSAKSRERDTYLFQDAEAAAQNAEATASKSSSKCAEKPDTPGRGKHFMTSIWKAASLKEKLHRSRSSALEVSSPAIANSDEAENIPELPGFQLDTLRRAVSSDPLAFKRSVAENSSPAESRKSFAAENLHPHPKPSLSRSTSAKDSSLDVSVIEGSLGAAVHRALSVREGRLKSMDRQKQSPASVTDKQIRIVLNSNAAPACGFLAEEFHPKEQIELCVSSEPKINCKSSENSHKNQLQLPEKSDTAADANQTPNQKAVKKTQSMRCSLVATDVEEAWAPARNSSYFGPISLHKPSLFGEFDAVNLSYTYSAMEGEAGSLHCSFCGRKIRSLVQGVKSGNHNADLCNTCSSFHTASDRFDPPKSLKKKGEFIKACRKFLHLSKKSSFSHINTSVSRD